MTAQIEAIGFVEAARSFAEDDFRGGKESCIALRADFSPVKVLFLFHQIDQSKIVAGQHDLPRAPYGRREALSLESGCDRRHARY